MKHLNARAFEELAASVVRERAPETDLEAMAFVFNLLRVATRVTQDFETTVHRPIGLSWAGARILFALWVAGPLSQREIARLSGVSRASISSALNTLEREDHVVRARVDADRRVVRVKLTDQGMRTFTEMFVRQGKREELWASALSPRERQTLVKLLRKLVLFQSADLAAEDEVA